MSDQDPQQELRGSVLIHSDEWEKSFVVYGLPKDEIHRRLGLLGLILGGSKEEVDKDTKQIAFRLTTTRIGEDDYELVRDDRRVYNAEEAVRQSRSAENIDTLALTEWQVLYEGFSILLQDPPASD